MVTPLGKRLSFPFFMPQNSILLSDENYDYQWSQFKPTR